LGQLTNQLNLAGNPPKMVVGKRRRHRRDVTQLTAVNREIQDNTGLEAGNKVSIHQTMGLRREAVVTS
jgi:hypothetical protein